MIEFAHLLTLLAFESSTEISKKLMPLQRTIGVEVRELVEVPGVWRAKLGTTNPGANDETLENVIESQYSFLELIRKAWVLLKFMLLKVVP